MSCVNVGRFCFLSVRALHLDLFFFQLVVAAVTILIILQLLHDICILSNQVLLTHLSLELLLGLWLLPKNRGKINSFV